MSAMEEKAAETHEMEDVPRNTSVFSEKAHIPDFKAAAIEAENEEHNMTVLQAVKAYPMASMWAFIMSCCIVRLDHV